VRIESCVISGMSAQGIYHQADNGEMLVLDTVVRDTADTGIALVASNASILLDHVRSEHNQAAGFYLAPTATSVAVASIIDSLFAKNGGNGIWADSLSGAATYIRVARSAIADNGQPGFYAQAAAAGAAITATLIRNSFTNFNGSLGVYLLGGAGFVSALASENDFSVDSGLFADATGVALRVAGNSGGGLKCGSGTDMRSFGNNHFVKTAILGGCAYSTAPDI
jgi:hypothetical protein